MPETNSTSPQGLARIPIVGTLALLAFGLLEQWPERLPGWLARSVLQLVAVEAVIPFV